MFSNKDKHNNSNINRKYLKGISIFCLSEIISNLLCYFIFILCVVGPFFSDTMGTDYLLFLLNWIT